MKIYNSSDTCPIGCFWNLQKSGNLSWLIIQDKSNYLSGDLIEPDDFLLPELQKKAEDIQDSYPNSAYDENDVDKRLDYRQAEFISLTSKDEAERVNMRNYLNTITLNKSGKTQDNMFVLAQLSSELNMRIDPFECTITEFYNLSENLNQKAKASLSHGDQQPKYSR